MGTSEDDLEDNSLGNTGTVRAFLFDDGRMMDLGGLGGTVTSPQGINNRGQVVGWGGLAGNLVVSVSSRPS